MAVRDPKTVDQLRKCFQNNESAVELALMIIGIADVWDDLVDGDEPVTRNDVNRAMWFALSGLPRNAFYRQFQDELLPLMEVGIFNWIASDELRRRGGTKELEIANVIRHGVSDVFVHMARLIGGFEWAAQAAVDIKLLAQNDTLEEYLKE
jgi:hypothetical protein